MKIYTTYKYFLRALLTLFILSFFIAGCNGVKHDKKNEKAVKTSTQNDLAQIKKSGELKVVVDYNSTNYFVYRGKPMGFQYELLKELANELNVELKLSVSNNLQETFDGLINGTYDLIAKNLTITKERSEEIDFTVPINQTRQVLVQRNRKNSSDSAFIKTTLELAGKKIYVQKNTSYYNRLQNLSEEIGSQIDIVEDTIYGVEQLITKVAEGELDYTVCDENVAKLNKTYYPDLDVSLKVSFNQNIAWAVRKGSVEWKEYLDKWITKFERTGKYKYLYHKYFNSSRIAGRLDSDFHSITGGQISEYDDVVKKLANKYNWDWRLISSIMYQESRFNPNAGSWAGAYGLMQIMPTTAEGFGLDDLSDPEQNIKGGILLLNWLDQQFIESIPDSTERIKFVLASYNIGLGHVMDAQRLAEKYDKNRYVWNDNVDFFLRNKSSEKYYKDPVAKYGYCRGEQAYNYVSRVMTNYDHYLNVIPE